MIRNFTFNANVLNQRTAVLFSSKTIVVALVVLFNFFQTKAQTVLNADGPGDTYELINSVLAPGRVAVEAPDQTTVSSGQVLGSHPDFGRHIAEVWDDELGKYVFEFYAHLDTGETAVLDNDVSTEKTDRQRVEIKTFASSPANLIGTVGETVTYKWRFRVPVGFLPTSNFTHLHQVKAVDGDDSNPIFSLTARKGTPNKMEVNFVASATSGTTKLGNLNLSLFEGVWVEVTEIIKVGTAGEYSILITRVDNNAVVFTYANDNMLTIRADNSFIRPKWGIYRSIVSKSIMRDEAVRFSDFSIGEGALSVRDVELENEITLYPNPLQDYFIISDIMSNKYTGFTIYDANGRQIASKKIISNRAEVSFLASGVYFVRFFNEELVSGPIKIIKN